MEWAAGGEGRVVVGGGVLGACAMSRRQGSLALTAWLGSCLAACNA